MMEDIIECLKLLRQANKAQQDSIEELHKGIVCISDGLQSLSERISKLENGSHPVTVESLFNELGRIAPSLTSSLLNPVDKP